MRRKITRLVAAFMASICPFLSGCAMDLFTGKTDEKGSACYFEMTFCFFYCMVAFMVFHYDVLEFPCIYFRRHFCHPCKMI